MKAALITIGVFLLVVVGGGAASYVGAHNKGVSFDNRLAAAWENNENILGQYSLKIQEMAQVPGMYANDLKEIVREAMSGRYGEDGSGAVFQWIQEQNPNVDSSLYIEIQREMKVGRNKFEAAQTQLVDVKRAYKDQLDFFWSGMWLRIAGFPKTDLSKYKIITSEYAQETFESGVDKGIKIN